MLESTIRTDELWFLCELYAPAIILGLANPNLGMLAADMEKSRVRGLRRLSDRGIVELLPNNTWHVHEPLAGIIKTVTSPNHSALVVTRAGMLEPMTCAFHRSATSVVSLRPTDELHHALRRLTDLKLIGELLFAPLVPYIYLDSEGFTFPLPASTVGEVQTLIAAGKRAEAKELLNTGGLSDPLLARLWLAFADPVASLSLIAFLHRDNPDRAVTIGLSVLATAHDLWLLQLTAQGLDQVQVTRVSKTELKERVERLLAPMEIEA